MAFDRHPGAVVVATLALGACARTAISFTSPDGQANTEPTTDSGSVTAGPIVGSSVTTGPISGTSVATGPATGSGGSSPGDAAGIGGAGGGCMVSLDCRRPLACLDRQCRAPCAPDVQCPEGQTCIAVPSGSKCWPIDNPYYCRDQSDCTPGFTCSFDGQCIVLCSNDNVCASPFKCIGGYCQFPAPDAGDASAAR
jgi:hypothetical protein